MTGRDLVVITRGVAVVLALVGVTVLLIFQLVRFLDSLPIVWSVAIAFTGVAAWCVPSYFVVRWVVERAWRD